MSDGRQNRSCELLFGMTDSLSKPPFASAKRLFVYYGQDKGFLNHHQLLQVLQ